MPTFCSCVLRAVHVLQNVGNVHKDNYQTNKILNCRRTSRLLLVCFLKWVVLSCFSSVLWGSVTLCSSDRWLDGMLGQDWCSVQQSWLLVMDPGHYHMALPASPVPVCGGYTDSSLMLAYCEIIVSSICLWPKSQRFQLAGQWHAFHLTMEVYAECCQSLLQRCWFVIHKPLISCTHMFIKSCLEIPPTAPLQASSLRKLIHWCNACYCNKVQISERWYFHAWHVVCYKSHATEAD